MNINSVIASTTNASYSPKSNKYMYKISAGLVSSISNYIRLRTVCYLVWVCNTEQWNAIKFCVRLLKCFVESYSMIQQAFSHDDASRTTIYKWRKRYKNSRELLDDDKQSRSLLIPVHDKNVSKLDTLLLEQHHITLWIIPEKLNIGKYVLCIILIEKLNRR